LNNVRGAPRFALPATAFHQPASINWHFPPAYGIVGIIPFALRGEGVFEELQTPMANDSCGPTPPSEPPKPGARMVQCVKFGRELPGLDRVPWRGELGKRVYESVSKDAWKLWVEHSKMVMNEYRLNPLDPNSQKIMEEQMELFFFGAGSALPEGYVAPKAKG
jgi:Fe-S cluster biosynthesis and repair protein YggX